MPPTIATSVPATTGSVHFLNIEYLFYLLYTWLFGAHAASSGGGISFAWLIPILTTVWVVITILAYLLALGFLALLVYATLRMHQFEDEEALKYTTLTDGDEAGEATEHLRWSHIRELIESTQENDWRQAIIEADIILDDMLTRLGYAGDTVSDKLKSIDPTRFQTLDQAWDAHKVRNEIAHQGSSFQLTDRLAYRTILEYENVFREHGEI